jgi:hypothetical protein
VIDRQFLGLAIALALMVVSLKNVFLNFFRKADARSFFGHFIYYSEASTIVFLISSKEDLVNSNDCLINLWTLQA